MRLAIVVIVGLVVAIPAAAVGGGVASDGLGAAGPREVKVPLPHSTGVPDGRIGGETIGDATSIPSLPFSDTASTTGRVDDYDWVCPYTGSTSPDVVYSLAVGVEMWITVDLCSSEYDTKVYVVQDDWPNVLYCNDDAACGYSGYQSKLEVIALAGGHTYYIVVDGYGDSSGTYVLSITEEEPCTVECPPGAIIEGEPDCYDDYVDMYNGGCNSAPFVFQNITSFPNGTATICGRSGTYLYGPGSMNYRDTDWYRVYVNGPWSVTYCCEAEFPLTIFIIDAGSENCIDYTILGTASGEACEQVCLTRTVGTGYYWFWAGPSVFSGVPCGSDYVATIGNPPVPVEPTSWGTIKALYK